MITESYLTDIADAIRAKNGSSDTYTPPQMAAAIEAIPTGGGVDVEALSVTQNGTYTAPTGKAYSPVTVNVSGGGGSEGVYVGTGAPDASIGSDGDYYYQRAKKGDYGYTSTPAQSSSTSQTGYEFIANEAITISGLRALNANTSGTISLLLAQLDGTVLGRIDNVPVNGEWAMAYFDTPIQLTAGEHYIVQAIRSGTGFKYQNKSSTVFNSKITGVQGRYGSLPGSIDSSNIYSADIIIANDDNIYVVTNQYYKSSGAWEVIA